ncbi:hypothetical protein [Nocardioides sp. YIM 152588]|uniref:hypothetical protein n=1 Tax=Nocardioides sp. YIM 152588 TaxID=3158259 RepID=UPI0032E4E8FD
MSATVTHHRYFGRTAFGGSAKFFGESSGATLWGWSDDAALPGAADEAGVGAETATNAVGRATTVAAAIPTPTLRRTCLGVVLMGCFLLISLNSLVGLGSRVAAAARPGRRPITGPP